MDGTHDRRGADLVRALREAAEPLPPIEDEAVFGPLFDRFGEAKIVLLGEASHGTSEFYRARAAITRRLVEAHGFRIVAVEADWPDAARMDRFVRLRDGASEDGEAFARFPRWMWRNAEVADFLRRLRGWNEKRPAEDRVEFRGLDLYSLHQSIDAVLEYLDRTDRAAAEEARERYGCLTPYHGRPELYGAVATRTGKSCEDAAIDQLLAMLEKQLIGGADGEDFFDAAQNARVVQAAETYYRAMYWGAVESWNLRDRHMYDTLRQVLDARGPGAKAVVWAHNSHIGNAAATDMGRAGEWNIGQLCREAFGREAVLIGFGTDRGTVAAADDWGEPMEVKSVTPSLPDSWERMFLEAGVPASLTSWRDDEALAAMLKRDRLERAIGVIYRPRTERRSHYFDAELSSQFDAWVWFEQTTAVTPLPGADESEGGADTFPFGV
ncbi:MAG TPA: erythromycin esterase family protein [Caulobacteraceae bacterium]|nr:erythromycin esterase family protein [Caulobacteraceae bacterium]